MDAIKIKLPIIGKNLKPFIAKINGIYNNIDADLVETTKKIVDLNNQDTLCVLSILKHLYDNNILQTTLTNYSQENQHLFKEIMETQNKPRLAEWLNSYGRIVMSHVNHLLKTNRIPQHMYNSAIDPNIMNEFVELYLMEHIHNKLNYNHIYTIKYKNLDITLNIYSKKNSISYNVLNDIVERIIVCGIIKSTEVNINIDVDIYLTPFKKKCDYYKPLEILGPREINSGASIVWKKLFVFRQEELNKVLVHELVHYLALDLHEVPFANFSDYFNVSSNNKVLLNEAYTEIMGLLINTCIYSDKFSVVKELLNKELKYSMYQSAKILTIFNFENADQFFKKCDGDKFKQNTDIFSYFIVKTAILMDLDEFLTLYYENKISPFTFKDYILPLLLSKKYVAYINKFMVYIQNNKQSDSLLNTLRMTHYDL
jgi:hypothetical protein